MSHSNIFYRGFKAMLPITTGVIPFGMVMGTVTSEAGLSFEKSTLMNLWAFAGAAQLAAVDLMSQHAASVVVIITGLMINLRFLLYSAALVPTVKDASTLTKMLCAYFITDQNYAVMSGHRKNLQTEDEARRFYLGASTSMFLIWNASVMVGFVFGNLAPPSWSLDYAVPVSFVALLIPNLKNRKHVAVAIFSTLTSLMLYSLPMRIGLILTALLSLGFATFLSRKKEAV